jgi:DNA polymerase-3 subunit delta
MRISTEQLSQHLKRGVAGCYTVFGAEPLLVIEAADRIRDCVRTAGYSEREVLIAEQHFSWKALDMSARSASLFSTRRILELRIPNGKPGVEGGKALQALAAQLLPDTLVLIVLPELDWRTLKASWFEALDAAGVTVEAKQVKRSELPAWLAARLREQQQSADMEALEFIAERVEGNLMAAHQEVQKLALLFSAGPLTFDNVKSAVLDVARFDIFDLGAAVLARDVAHFARMLDGLRGEGVAPPLVLWALVEEIRALARVLTLISAGQSLTQALRSARVWGVRQKIIERHARDFALPQLETALLHATQIDRVIKGIVPGDPWDALLKLGISLSRKTAKAA